MTKPIKMLQIAKKGETSGLPRKEATVAQSRVMAPMARPWSPDPSCWAVTDLEKHQQIHEMLVAVGKK